MLLDYYDLIKYIKHPPPSPKNEKNTDFQYPPPLPLPSSKIMGIMIWPYPLIRGMGFPHQLICILSYTFTYKI